MRMPVSEQARAISVSEIHEEDLSGLYAEMLAAEPKLVGPDGMGRALPSDLGSFLGQILAHLKQGGSITLRQDDTTLTTMKAAQLLGVSRQFLARLLEAGLIPFHLVGTHRRVYARDLLVFKAKRDSARRKTLDDLARAEMDEGLYDRVPLPNVANPS